MEQNEKYTSKLGYYPCIYLTLKDAGLISYEMMIMQLKIIMMELYYENRYLLEKAEMAPGERNLFNKILAAEANEEEYRILMDVMFKNRFFMTENQE